MIWPQSILKIYILIRQFLQVLFYTQNKIALINISTVLFLHEV